MNSQSSSNEATLPLVVVVGPTASGKTALGIRLAHRLNGEIICADSRTIYRGMDIGTAKPNKKERLGITHYGLDLVDPGDRFTVADFKKYADQKIQEIRAKGKIPLLIGGTGLYINAVLYNYSFSSVDEATRLKRRSYYDRWSLNELTEYCTFNNIQLPNNYQNKRHVINTIVTNGDPSRSDNYLLKNSYIVGIATYREELHNQMLVRAAKMIQDGCIAEAIQLAERYGWNSEAMTANAYRLIHQYVSGTITKYELQQKIVSADSQLAKRQITWFKRDKNIYWGTLAEVENYIYQMTT